MKYTIIVLLCSLLASCNNWLNLAPENERLSGEYWTSKDDVKNTMMSCYTRMRECQDLMFKWGELRADVLVIGGNNEDMIRMNEQDINSENVLTKWNAFYKVINATNAVIQYSPSVLDKDPLFSEEESDQYQAEAKVVRSLMYFYLVRTFREVPLITDAYLVDVQELKQPKATEREIIDRLILDLQWSLKRLRLSYGEGWKNKCRATRWAAQTLLANVYLWDGQHEKCVEACELILDSERYSLMALILEEEEEDEVVEKEKWFDIFYPGLTDESIWELYYDEESNQKNKLYNDFNGNTYKLRQKIVDDFKADENKTDIRGEDNSFQKDAKIWKYLGTTNNGTSHRGGADRSPNWTFYRYAEVYFMYAEACILYKDDAEYRLKAMTAINQIRKRARITELDENEALNMSKEAWIQLVLEDKMKEFIGEGKRWFDLIRIAKKGDYKEYKQIVMDILLENVPMAEKTIYQAKLANSFSLYLPIYKKEIDMGKGVLVQNPAYQ